MRFDGNLRMNQPFAGRSATFTVTVELATAPLAEVLKWQVNVPPEVFDWTFNAIPLIVDAAGVNAEEVPNEGVVATAVPPASESSSLALSPTPQVASVVKFPSANGR
jgi:hypothetical protein